MTFGDPSLSFEGAQKMSAPSAAATASATPQASPGDDTPVVACPKSVNADPPPASDVAAPASTSLKVAVVKNKESWNASDSQQKNDEVTAPETLDLDAAWASVCSAADANAAQRIAEYLVRILTSPRQGGTMEMQARQAEKSAGVTAADFGESSSSPEPHADSDFERGPESIYGEKLLLSLRCEERKDVDFTKHSQKDVCNVLVDTYGRFREIQNEATTEVPAAGARDVIVSALVMEAVPSLVFTLIEGLETGAVDLTVACRDLLDVLSNVGNPREFFVMLKMSLSKVNTFHEPAVYKILIGDLLNYWTSTIPRISGRRALFLKDVVFILNTCMFRKLEESSDKVDDESEVEEQLCDRTRFPSTTELRLLNFLEVLAVKQREDDAKEAILLASGEDDPKFFPPEAQAKALEGMEARSSENKERKLLAALRQAVSAREATAQDAANERMASLALLVRLAARVVRKMDAAPADAELRGTGESGRSTSSGGKSQSEVSRAVSGFVSRARSLLAQLGFDNVLDACQRLTDLCGYEFLSTSSRAVAEIARPQQRRNRRTLTFFGVSEVACYLVMMLTFSESGLERTSMACGFKSSAFQFSDASYAFDLLMPFLAHLIDQTNTILVLYGVEVLRVLIDRIPNRSVLEMTSALRNPYGSGFMQANGLWYGFSISLVKAVGQIDNPRDRAFVYETFQCLLGKLSTGRTRYSVVEALVLESHRHIVSSQLITELKDSVRIIDEEEPLDVSDEYRTRLVHFVLPRFLMPRKESLASISTALAACNVGLFIALSDACKASTSEYSGDPRMLAALKTRMEFCLAYLKIGRESVRALAAVAEHDRKQTDDLDHPTLARKASPQAHGLFSAATRTLNDCIASKSALDPAIACLLDALKSVS